MRQLRLLRLSVPIVSTISKVSCKFLHDQLDKVGKVPLSVGQVGQLCHAIFLHGDIGDIDDIGDIANFATFASAFFF